MTPDDRDSSLLVSQRTSRWIETSIGRQVFLSPSIDWDACYVYIAWGHDHARPLYIGKSREPLNRIGRHLRATAWSAAAVEWELLAYASEADALMAEAWAIHELDPLHNVIRGGSGGVRTRKRGTRKMPTALQAIPKPIHGISADQLEIIARVQNRRPSHPTDQIGGAR
jgi:hypothetical protein